jgi:hypothetical protein
MRSLILAGLLSLIAAAAGAQDSGTLTLGKSTPRAETTGAAAKAAPVGHRQPKQSDLSGAVQRDENSGNGSDPLGPLPQICRNC